MAKIDELIEQIKKDQRFLKLKNVIENNPYHDHQVVYDHTLEVVKSAQQKINGQFISNLDARKKFLEFTKVKIGELTRRECMLLVALLHDISKAGKYIDQNKEYSILKTMKDKTTSAVGHEYFSSILGQEILMDYKLKDITVNYICKIIKLHGTFNEIYFKNLNYSPIEEIINDVKSKSEEVYIETLFNIYCDCFNAPPFAFVTKIIEEIFNSPSLYSKRTYYI